MNTASIAEYDSFRIKEERHNQSQQPNPERKKIPFQKDIKSGL